MLIDLGLSRRLPLGATAFYMETIPIPFARYDALVPNQCHGMLSHMRCVFCGSVAPEVFYSMKFSKLSDVWMIGVLLWSVLKRQPPFQDLPLITQYRDAHSAGGIRGPPLKELPDYAAPFLPILRACLQPLGDAASRPTVAELLTMFRDVRVPAGDWPSPFVDCRQSIAVIFTKCGYNYKVCVVCISAF